MTYKNLQKDKIIQEINQHDSKIIINLASQEYFSAINSSKINKEIIEIIFQENNTTNIECSLSDGQGSNPTYVLTINKSDKKGICTGNNEPEFSIEKK